MMRRICSMLMWMMIVVLTVGSGTLTALAQESTPAAPPVDSEQLFDVAGIDAPVLAQAPIPDATGIGGTILLEQIELPAGAEMAPRTTTSPELYYLQSGTLWIQDDFGFGTAIPASSGLGLNAGTSFTAANQGAEPATVLRLRLSQGEAASSEGAAQEATPVDLTGGSVPAGNDIQPIVLVQLPVTGLSFDSGQLFLSRATFSPGAETGEQGHAGPIGLYVETGTLNVVSPSGFQGTIATGQGVSLPAETPLQASVADSEAVVLIVGIGAAEEPFAEVTPEPEPTPTPGPTAVPAPTQEPTPTPEPVTQSGTILQMGETWEANGATLTVQADTDGWGGIYLRFTYHNSTDSRVDFLVPSGVVRVYDDQRQTWALRSGSIENERVILDPSESASYDVRFDCPENGFEYSANVFVVVTAFGAIDSAKWGLTWDKNRILTIPPDAVDPTVSGQSSTGQEQASVAPTGGGGQAATINIHDSVTSLSPPLGMMLVEQGSLDAAAITASFSDPAAARTFFDDWGWQENAFVYYEPPNGGSSDTGLVYIDVGLHRFANADGARQALDYFANVRRDQMFLADTTIDPIGEQSRAIMGQTSMGTEASVYARAGAVVIRVSVMSVASDPLQAALDITRTLIASPASVSAPVDLASLLPASGEIPGHLVLAGDTNRSLAEVAANYTDPAQITAMFQGWGWQGNVTRAFGMPDGVYPEQSQINGIYISIHAFGGPQDAIAALNYSLTDQAASTGASEIGSPGLGDSSRALFGQMSYGNEVTLLVQRNNLLIRLSVAQLEGDPTPAATNIMQGILSRAG